MKAVFQTKRERGFSLMELLVVITITLILAALALSAFREMTHNGRSVKCVGNLRQIGALMQTYLGDNNGRYPYSFTRESNRFWAQDLAENAGLKDLRTFICPAAKPINAELFANRGGYAYVSYALNRYGVAPGSGDLWSPAKAMAIPEPSQMLLAVDYDAPNQPGDGWYNVAYSEMRDNWASAMRHTGTANALWCDGHVSSVNRDTLVTGSNTALPWKEFQYVSTK